MAKYFQINYNSVRENLNSLKKKKQSSFVNKGNSTGLSALELGSGNGFVSMCFVAVSRDILDELVVTDIKDHLSLIKKTVSENSHIVSKSPSGENKVNVHIFEHRWGEFNQTICEEDIDIELDDVESKVQTQLLRGQKKFDFIFGSDVAYYDHLHEPLVKSLKKLSHEETISIIGVTMNDTSLNFFDTLREFGFRYDRIADHLMAPEFRGTNFGLFVITRSPSWISLRKSSKIFIDLE